MELPASHLTYKQRRKVGPRAYTDHGTPYRITLEIRHDDECKNGHNTFAMTFDEWRKLGDNRWEESACGCDEETIARHFPEFAPYLKWHGCTTEGPFHYIANTLYLAGERDHWGKLKGEPSHWDTFIQFGANPIKHKPGRGFVEWLQGRDNFDLEVIPIEHGRDSTGYKFGPKYTYGGFAEKWHECPFDTIGEAMDFLRALQNCSPQFVRVPVSWGEGKARELEAARRAAIWHDATDADLMLPPEELKAKLEARLPGLMLAFKTAVESLGFVY